MAGFLAAGSVRATVLTIWVLIPGAEAEPDHSRYYLHVDRGDTHHWAVAIFLRRRIRDYALARADNPSRARYAGPITVVFGAVLGCLYPCAP